MANLSTDWPFWLAATLLGLLSAFILHRSLLHNRSRGRRRCPKCWYDMSGADASRENGLVCPECGRDARRERRLYKTRRRWGWAAVGLVAAALSFSASKAPEVRRRGWLNSTPTTLLILAAPGLRMPTLAERRGPGTLAGVPIRAQLGATLRQRVMKHELRGWQLDALLWWCIQDGALEANAHVSDRYSWTIVHLALGYDFAIPPGSTPDWFVERAWRKAASRTVCARERWPVDVPLRMRVVHDPLFGARAGGGSVKVKTNDPVVVRYQTGNEPKNGPWNDRSFDLGIRDAGLHSLRLVVERHLEFGGYPDSLHEQLLWFDYVDVEVEIAGRLESFLVPMTSPEFVEAGTASEWTLSIHEAPHERATIRPPPRLREAFLNGEFPMTATFSPSILIFRNGEPVGLAAAWWRGEIMAATSPDALDQGTREFRLSVTPLSPRLFHDPDPCDEWTATVTGEPAVALRDIRATEYWKGQFQALIEVWP